MLHKISFSKNSRHYLLYTQKQQQPDNSYIRAEFQWSSLQLCILQNPSPQLSQPIRTIHVHLTQSSTRQQQWTASIDSNDLTLNCTSPLHEFYIKIHLKYEILNANINDTSQRNPEVLLLNFTTMLVDLPLLLPYQTASTSLVFLFYSQLRTAGDGPLWLHYLIPTCQVTGPTMQG